MLLKRNYNLGGKAVALIQGSNAIPRPNKDLRTSFIEVGIVIRSEPDILEWKLVGHQSCEAVLLPGIGRLFLPIRFSYHSLYLRAFLGYSTLPPLLRRFRARLRI